MPNGPLDGLGSHKSDMDRNYFYFYYNYIPVCASDTSLGYLQQALRFPVTDRVKTVKTTKPQRAIGEIPSSQENVETFDVEDSKTI